MKLVHQNPSVSEVYLIIRGAFGHFENQSLKKIDINHGLETILNGPQIILSERHVTWVLYAL